MNALSGKTILVGVSGGIAAYKTCYLVSRLVKCGACVHVMMTKNATEFVSPVTFESLSHNRAVVNTFDRNFSWEIEHVSLAKKADAVVIAPATANVIAKLACGIADDFLTTTVLACNCPIVVAPAMNTAMLDNPATVANIATLEKRGVNIVYGECGNLACGDVGRGRMAEPDMLFDRLYAVFSVKKDFRGKTVLVTAGGTHADIDPVRFIGNRSSGKMGYNIALAAYERGAKIVFVKGYTDKFDIPEEWTVEQANTTADMLEAVKKHASSSDITVMAAAPCDYEIIPREQKIKDETLELSLKKAPDIAAWVGEHKSGKLVIFAAETSDCENNAVCKLRKKHADLVVLNDVTKTGAGFDVDTNIVTLITKEESISLPLMTKRAVADAVLDKIAAL